MDSRRIKTLSRAAGFSLVELMVVVAIIGVLAAIAVPGYEGYIERAEKAEVKAILSGIYTAEKAHYAQYDTYSGDLSEIGLEPVPLKYFGLIGFSTNTRATPSLYTHGVSFGTAPYIVSGYSPEVCMVRPGGFNACATRTTDSTNVLFVNAFGQKTEFSINEKKVFREY